MNEHVIIKIILKYLATKSMNAMQKLEQSLMINPSFDKHPCNRTLSLRHVHSPHIHTTLSTLATYMKYPYRVAADYFRFQIFEEWEWLASRTPDDETSRRSMIKWGGGERCFCIFSWPKHVNKSQLPNLTQTWISLEHPRLHEWIVKTSLTTL